ncbi:hypothetical protein [Erysipelothrix sp. P66]|uniref:hypothetical protein n=1 Tax=Erysipelothrix sp. P66 TaxID=3141531 RepID=UPI00315DAB63
MNKIKNGKSRLMLFTLVGMMVLSSIGVNAVTEGIKEDDQLINEIQEEVVVPTETPSDEDSDDELLDDDVIETEHIDDGVSHENDEDAHSPEVKPERETKSKEDAVQKDTPSDSITRMNPGDVSVFDTFSNAFNTKFDVYLNAGESLAIEWTFIRKSGINNKHNLDYTLEGPGVSKSLKFVAINNTPANAGSNQTMFDVGDAREVTEDALAGNPEVNKFDATNENHWLKAPASGIYLFTIPKTKNITARYRFHILKADGTRALGRTWSEQIELTQNANIFEDFVFYHMMIDGYIYKQSLYGFNGQDSLITSDAAGLVEESDSACAPIYESALKKGGIAFKDEAFGIPNYILAADDSDCSSRVTNYKLFASVPDDDMPETATYADGESTWLTQEIKLPEFVSMTYSRTSHDTQAVDVRVDINNYEGLVEVKVDTNNNGSYDDDVDVTLSTIYRSGQPVTLSWHGLNGLGVPVPITQTVHIFSDIDRSGEIHFVGYDIEDLRSGITIERINGLMRPIANADVVYWDHRPVNDRIVSGCGPFEGQMDATAGTESNGSFKWRYGNDCIYRSVDGQLEGNGPFFGANSGQGKSFGDIAYIHEWTYEKLLSPVEIDREIPGLNPYFQITKEVVDDTGDLILTPGEVFTYTIKAHNEGSVMSDMKIKDLLTEVQNYVTVGDGTIEVKRNNVAVPGHTIASLMGGGLEFTGMLPLNSSGAIQDEVEITLTFTANANINSIPAPHHLDNTAHVYWDVDELNEQGQIVTTEYENDDSAFILTGESGFEIVKRVKDLGLPIDRGHEVNGIVSPGEAIEYEIEVENTKQTVLDSVVIYDELKEILNSIKEKESLGSVTVEAVFDRADGNTATSSLITTEPLTLETLTDKNKGVEVKLSAGDRVTLRFKVTTIDELEGELLRNKAFAKHEEELKDSSTSIPIGSSVLIIHKKVTDDDLSGAVSQGEAFTYEIVVKNDGNAPAYNVEIMDDFDGVAPFIAERPEDVVVTMIHDGVTSTYSLAELMSGIYLVRLDPGKTAELNFTVSLKATLDLSTITHHNEAGNPVLYNVAYADFDPSPEVEIPVELPKLKIEKSVLDADENGWVTQNETFTYTIEVTNIGLGYAHGVTIQDPFTDVLDSIKEKTALSNVAVSYVFNHLEGKPIVSTLDDGTDLTLQNLVDGFKAHLGSQESITLTFSVTALDDLSALASGSLVNKVTAKNIYETVDATAIIFAGNTGLSIYKKAEIEDDKHLAEPGDTVTYTIGILNKGPMAAKNVYVIDPMTALLDVIEEKPEAVSVVSTQGNTYTLADLIQGIVLANLDDQELVELVFTVTLKPTLDVSTIPNMNESGFPMIPNIATVNDVPTTEIEVPVDLPKLDLEKLVTETNGDDFVEENEGLTYTIHVRNQSNVMSYKTIIRDNLKDIINIIQEKDHLDQVVLNYSFKNLNDEPVTSTLVGDTSLCVSDLVEGIIVNLGGFDELTLTFEVTAMSNLEGVEEFVNTATVSNPFEEIETSVKVPVKTPDEPTIPITPINPPEPGKPHKPLLPSTGVSALPLRGISLGLMVAGTVLMVLKRKRK